MNEHLASSPIRTKADELKAGRRVRCATYDEADSVKRVVESDGYGVSNPIQQGAVWVLTLTMDPDGDPAA